MQQISSHAILWLGPINSPLNVSIRNRCRQVGQSLEHNNGKYLFPRTHCKQITHTHTRRPRVIMTTCGGCVRIVRDGEINIILREDTDHIEIKRKSFMQIERIHSVARRNIFKSKQMFSETVPLRTSSPRRSDRRKRNRREIQTDHLKN